MAKLFDRIWRVTAFLQPDKSTFIGANPQFFEKTGDAVEIVAQRVQFSVTKNLGKEPNKCVIKIANLSQHSRSEFEKLPVQVMLHAGYDGVARLMFVGDVTRSWSLREGTEIITTLIVHDGMRAFAHARMNRSYKPPTQVKRVLEDAAKSMGLKLPRDIEQSAALSQPITTGVSMTGPTRDLLTRLLSPYGYHWSVQNGKMQVIRDEDIAPGDEILIDGDTGGLIGFPEKTSPDKPKGKTEIKFQVLLHGDIAPGRRVKLRSEFFDTSVKVTDVTHQGDSHGQEWTTSVTSRPL